METSANAAGSISICSVQLSVSRQAQLWLLAATGLSIALLVPLFVTDVPSIQDYPNHLARFFVLAHPEDAVLSKFYAPHWTILPNLGMDIVGAGLLRVLDPYIAGKVMLALSLLVPVVGVASFHRAVFGRLSYWPLASGLVAYNAAFFLGFMNFLLSLGVAFTGAAVWISLRKLDRPAAKAVAGAIAASVAFFTHVFGVSFLFLLISADEVAALHKRWSSEMLDLRDVTKAVIPLVVALVPAAALYLLSPLAEVSAGPSQWFLLLKALRLFSPFAIMSLRLTIISAAAFVAGVTILLRRLDLAPGFGLVLAVLAAVYVVAPVELKGGSCIDLRAAIMAALWLFAGAQPRISQRPALILGAAIVGLIVVRLAFVSATWIETRRDVADMREAMAGIEPGARVLAVTGSIEGRFWQPARWVLPGIYRLLDHIPALLLIERRAFWPFLFADPTQQPIAVLPPFDRVSQTLKYHLDWNTLANEPYPAELLRRERYLAGWRQSFDYLLVTDAHPEARSILNLSPIYTGEFAKLYRINR
ncbi:hypothetical protein [Bradyrhizobium elkanii]|uniref:hypothetical protein n=1 Tax=Bradyrhizobium elkanii TaxID=29448 RepID=UPI00209D16A3|nr:hypothetical protein [Bradyrhizobium elkanii]MCP1970837.1 hypothetical protein [Bradyrhizobium elkanii]MCS4107656.1 hypothetical protein [Bradyrhizobium elkanii]